MDKALPSENISVTIKIPILHRLDKFCLRHDLHRSQVIEKAVKRLLAVELADNPEFWQKVYDNEEI